MNIIGIPLNDNGLPLINERMKAECLGEFTFEVIDNIDEDGVETYRDVVVPWTVCKEIYKKMALLANDELGRSRELPDSQP